MIIFFDIETISDESVNREKHIERYDEKINFMGEFNKIFCISVAYIKSDGTVSSKTLSDVNEEDTIKSFFQIIQGHTLCGYNIKGFDIPFIVKRAIKHGVVIPEQLKVFGKKPWEVSGIIDLQDVWKHIGMNACSLEVLCEHLGIKSSKEGEIHGDNVQEAYNNGRGNEICAYCEDDVRATIEVYERFSQLNLI